MIDIEKINLPASITGGCSVIAGPCSAESERQTLECARSLSALGVRVFRAGVWKPRTRPGNFEGAGEPALEWLGKVKAETGMMVATEVAGARHVEVVLLRQDGRSHVGLSWRRRYCLREADCQEDVHEN